MSKQYFSLLPLGVGRGVCSVFASYMLHNSLAYRADWSCLFLDEPPPGDHRARQFHTGRHLRIQYESPTANFNKMMPDVVFTYLRAYPHHLLALFSVACPLPCPNPSKTTCCMCSTVSGPTGHLHCESLGGRGTTGEGDGCQAGAPAK